MKPSSQSRRNKTGRWEWKLRRSCSAARNLLTAIDDHSKRNQKHTHEESRRTLSPRLHPLSLSPPTPIEDRSTPGCGERIPESLRPEETLSIHHHQTEQAQTELQQRTTTEFSRDETHCSTPRRWRPERSEGEKPNLSINPKADSEPPHLTKPSPQVRKQSHHHQESTPRD